MLATRKVAVLAIVFALATSATARCFSEITSVDWNPGVIITNRYSVLISVFFYDPEKNEYRNVAVVNAPRADAPTYNMSYVSLQQFLVGYDEALWFGVANTNPQVGKWVAPDDNGYYNVSFP